MTSRLVGAARSAVAAVSPERRRRRTARDRLSFRYSTDPPDDGKCVTDKDVESDEAVWALYERWCKSFNKKRDHAEMARRFYIFRFYAWTVQGWNSYVHKDLYALAHAKKQRDLGKHVCDWYLQKELRPYADGGDPVSEDWQFRLNMPPVSPASEEKN